MDSTPTPPVRKAATTPPKTPTTKKVQQASGGASSATCSTDSGSPKSVTPKSECSEESKKIAHDKALQLQKGSTLEFMTWPDGSNNLLVNVPEDNGKQLEFEIRAKKTNTGPALYELLCFPNYAFKIRKSNVGCVSPGSSTKVMLIPHLGPKECKQLADDDFKTVMPYIKVYWMSSDIGSSPSTDDIQIAWMNVSDDMRKELQFAKVTVHFIQPSS